MKILLIYLHNWDIIGFLLPKESQRTLVVGECQEDLVSMGVGFSYYF